MPGYPGIFRDNLYSTRISRGADAPVLEWSRRRAGQALTAVRTAAAAAARRSRLLCCGVVVRTCRHKGDEPGAVPSLCAGTPSISLHTTRKLTMLLRLVYKCHIMPVFVSCLGSLADPRIEENINQGGVELCSHGQHKIYGNQSQSEPYICLNHPCLL